MIHFTIKTSTTRPFWAKAEIWEYMNGCQHKKIDSHEFASMKGYTKAITMAITWAKNTIGEIS